MSAQNVELFWRMIDAFNRGDAEACVAGCDPEVEWHPFLAAQLSAGAYRGHDGIRAWFRDTREVFDTVHAEAHDVRDLGDRLVALGHIRARGKASGAEVDAPIGWVCEFRDGRFVHGLTLRSHADTLAAAGLGE